MNGPPPTIPVAHRSALLFLPKVVWSLAALAQG
jgi:hypothetical protein